MSADGQTEPSESHFQTDPTENTPDFVFDTASCKAVHATTTPPVQAGPKGPLPVDFDGSQADTHAMDALGAWLSTRLQEERAATENRHSRLLSEFQQRLNAVTPCTDLAAETDALATSTSCATLVTTESHPSRKRVNRSAAEHHEVAPAAVPRLAPVAVHGAAPADDDKESKTTATTADPSLADGTTMSPEDLLADVPEVFKPPPGCWGRFEAFVCSPDFDLISLGLILANTLLMSAQQQYRGGQIGNQIGYKNYETPPEESFPWADDLFQHLERMFAFIFAIEILFKLAAHRRGWFFDMWNYLDTLVVMLSLLTWLAPENSSGIPSKLTFTRMARFARMIRIVGKTKKSARKFEMMTVIITAISGCASALFWSLMIICFLQCIAGMTIGMVVEPFLANDERWVDDPASRDTVFEFYGTWWRAMLTMFQVSLANWAPPCRILFEHVHQAFSYFFLFYRCVIGFAVLSVVQAVFIQQTMKSMNSDKELAIQKKAMAKESESLKLRKVFQKLDTSQDGLLVWDEFQPLLGDDRMKATMGILDLDEDDLKELFAMLANGDGAISWEDLCAGVHHIKGDARSLDVVTGLSIMRRIEEKVDRLESHHHFHTPFAKQVDAHVPSGCCGGGGGWCI